MQTPALNSPPRPESWAGVRALAEHWPEYLIEAAALGMFMLSACLFGVLLEHPASPLRQAIEDSTARRGLMGIAMGATAFGLISSPWGQRSGAHMNPSVTLTFLTLGKIAPWDAAYYVAAQFLGGIAGVQLAYAIAGAALGAAPVNYVVTAPGPAGIAGAFWAEFAISGALMGVVLAASNSRSWARWTPLLAGALVGIYIFLEAPLSGMSMNPARTLGSAVAGMQWTALWIYFTAPPLGMFLAGLVYSLLKGSGGVRCAKLLHGTRQRCIFRCNYHDKGQPR